MAKQNTGPQGRPKNNPDKAINPGANSMPKYENPPSPPPKKTSGNGNSDKK